MKSNTKYSAIFAKLSTQSIDQLKEQFMLLDLATPSAERSIVKACIYEEIESRVGEVEAGSFIDAMDLIAA